MLQPRVEPLIKVFFRKLCVYLTPYPPHNSTAHQQPWGLTDVMNQRPEEIRCNSIRIPLPLKSAEQQRPHVHSCPHTCYHMVLMFSGRILSVRLSSTHLPKLNTVLRHDCMLALCILIPLFHSPF